MPKYYSDNQIRRMRMVEHVARIQFREICTGFWHGNCNESDHLEDLRINGTVI
jgi:hypothetical protein